jgi:hypothetical protein
MNTTTVGDVAGATFMASDIMSGSVKLTEEQVDKFTANLLKLEPLPDYKYNEPNALTEIQEYIDKTYNQHYTSKSKRSNVQVMESIIAAGHGLGFCMGAIMKYAPRYGKKNSYNRQDLLKIIHYAIIALSLETPES